LGRRSGNIVIGCGATLIFPSPDCANLIGSEFEPHPNTGALPFRNEYGAELLQGLANSRKTGIGLDRNGTTTLNIRQNGNINFGARCQLGKADLRQSTSGNNLAAGDGFLPHENIHSPLLRPRAKASAWPVPQAHKKIP
jgi:hypothetical protein